MRNQVYLGLFIMTIGLGIYLLTHDLRWIYAGLAGAAVPFLICLIWKERIPIKLLLRKQKSDRP